MVFSTNNLQRMNVIDFHGEQPQQSELIANKSGDLIEIM